MTTQLSTPANGPESDPFGPRDEPSSPFHNGKDWGWYYATQDFRVFAAAPGIVQHVYSSNSMGWVISLLHSDGTVSEYCHLAGPGFVTVGDTVFRRQHIGTMGNTGSAALGQRHLHFQYWVNGSRVDPAPYLTATAGGDITPIEEEEDIMDQTKYYYKTEGGTVYGIFGATYPGGFETSASEGTGQAWGKLFGKPDGAPWGQLSAAVWATLQAESQVLNQRWVAQQRAILGGVTVGSGGTFTADDRERLNAVPTAEQNGQATVTLTAAKLSK